MQESRLASLANGAATIVVKPALLPIARSLATDIGAALATAVGSPNVTVTIVADGPAPDDAPVDLGPPRAPIAEHPLVKQAIELFNGRLLSAGPRQRPKT